MQFVEEGSWPLLLFPVSINAPPGTLAEEEKPRFHHIHMAYRIARTKRMHASLNLFLMILKNGE